MDGGMVFMTDANTEINLIMVNSSNNFYVNISDNL